MTRRAEERVEGGTAITDEIQVRALGGLGSNFDKRNIRNFFFLSLGSQLLQHTHAFAPSMFKLK